MVNQCVGEGKIDLPAAIFGKGHAFQDINLTALAMQNAFPPSRPGGNSTCIPITSAMARVSSTLKPAGLPR